MPESPGPIFPCYKLYYWTDTLDICAIMLSIFSFIANLSVGILLFLLRSKKVETLALLRVLSLSCLSFAFVNILEDLGARSPDTGSNLVDSLICVLWSSRFAFWYTNAHIYNSLFYFACSRALEMLRIPNYPITTEKQRLATFMLLIFISSFLGTAPQLLLAHPHAKDCACAPITENLEILTVVYAHAYLWVAIFGLTYPAILVYICIALVLRARRSERATLLDELDQLSFRNFRPASTTTNTASTHPITPSSHRVPSSGDKSNAATPEKSTHVWSASFCILPLTAAYVASVLFEATCQLLSTAGFFTYKLRSPTNRFSGILMNLFTALVPLILFFHIPAMRSLIFAAIEFLKTRRRKVILAEAGGQSG
ncbi:hypothetical protein AAHC03_021134 [Spirometra sp. Aus1]